MFTVLQDVIQRPGDFSLKIMPSYVTIPFVAYRAGIRNAGIGMNKKFNRFAKLKLYEAAKCLNLVVCLLHGKVPGHS